MKTTIVLADDLAASVNNRITQKRISLRAAVHEALRLWLKAEDSRGLPPRISPDVGVMSGQGLTPEAAGQSWENLRALSS